jgi:hypothetical protein
MIGEKRRVVRAGTLTLALIGIGNMLGPPYRDVFSILAPVFSMILELSGPVVHQAVQRWMLQRGIRKVALMLEQAPQLPETARLRQLLSEANVTLAKSYLQVEAVVTTRAMKTKAAANVEVSRRPANVIAETSHAGHDRLLGGPDCDAPLPSTHTAETGADQKPLQAPSTDGTGGKKSRRFKRRTKLARKAEPGNAAKE